MDWLKAHQRKMERLRIDEERQSRDKILFDLKKKHFQEKKDEIITLKKRLEILEQDIKVYREFL